MLERILEYYKIEEKSEKEKKIKEYLRLIEERREWAGLTSRGFPEEGESAVVDTLGVLSVLGSKGKKDVADIGSGGGLAGVVISIVCPDWGVVMVESSARKAAFLAETIGSLGLRNARVENERAEKLVGRLSFDVALGRAAGELRKVAPTALRLLIPGGLYIAIKGSMAEMEAKEAVGAIAAYGGEMMGIEKPRYPDDFGIPDRVSLVVVRKI